MYLFHICKLFRKYEYVQFTYTWRMGLRYFVQNQFLRKEILPNEYFNERKIQFIIWKNKKINSKFKIKKQNQYSMPNIFSNFIWKVFHLFLHSFLMLTSILVNLLIVPVITDIHCNEKLKIFLFVQIIFKQIAHNSQFV
jgi:hypothetical protein